MATDLDALFQSLQAAATRAQLRWLSPLPVSQKRGFENSWLWSWNGNPDQAMEFVELALHAGTRVIYAEKPIFDLEAFVTRSLVSANLFDPGRTIEEVVEQVDPSVTVNQLMEWREYDGQPTGIWLMFWANGVVHELAIDAKWFEAFDTAIRASIAQLRADDDAKWATYSAVHRTRTRQMAEALAYDDRYARTRNESQRRYIAEEHFPELDHSDLNMVIELAANIYWDKVEPQREQELSAQVKRLQAEGMKPSTIALRLGISRDKVSRFLICDLP